jgi:hypothetical protein
MQHICEVWEMHTTSWSGTQEGENLCGRPSRRWYCNLNLVRIYEYTVRHIRITRYWPTVMRHHICTGLIIVPACLGVHHTTFREPRVTVSSLKHFKSWQSFVGNTLQDRSLSHRVHSCNYHNSLFTDVCVCVCLWFKFVTFREKDGKYENQAVQQGARLYKKTGQF